MHKSKVTQKKASRRKTDGGEKMFILTTAEVDSMLLEAFRMLHVKGYKVDKLCMITGKNDFEQYLECPYEFLTFKGRAKLPSLPIGFELVYLTDEKFSILDHRLEDNLSRSQLFARNVELASSLMLWAIQLPEADTIEVA